MKALLAVAALLVIGIAVWLVWPKPADQNNPPPQNQPRSASPSEQNQNQSQPQPVNQKPEHDIFEQVWSKNGYDGASFEYKVNCGSDYETLNECFLYDLTRVSVTDPSGGVTELEKDFNIQEYSGEITRRWVIYGPANAGLPVAGDYTYTYYQGDQVAYEHTISYVPDTIGYPTNMTWQRQGNDLLVQWTPPAGMKPGNTYKVILFPEGYNIISQLLQWDATSARLKDIPLPDGTQIEMNVASYFDNGYAYPENVKFAW